MVQGLNQRPKRDLWSVGVADSSAEGTNSFYRFGDSRILSIEQDELSKLWKVKLSTDSVYVVSEEFDRTKGMYANAPDAVVLEGLMGFSESIAGKVMSVFDVMHLFIERCFSDSAFSDYTENAIWLSMEYPQYAEVEEMLNTFNARLKWFPKEYPIGEAIDDIVYKQPSGEMKSRDVQNLLEGMRVYRVTSVFMHDDSQVERFFGDSALQSVPVFKSVFKNGGNGRFLEFRYWRH